MATASRVAIGLGSNLGDRLATLREAMRRIEQVASVLGCSYVYETEPVGGPEQAAFLNAALLVAWPGDESAASFVELLDALQRIELDLGRTRVVRWGPRTLDLDVLWIDGIALDEARLVVPHPRLAERAFALVPLLDVAPDAREPRTGAPYAITDADRRLVVRLARLFERRDG